MTWCCAAANEKSNVWRTVWSASAAPASAHTSAPMRSEPIARPAKITYSFVRSKTESSHAPSFENVRV